MNPVFITLIVVAAILLLYFLFCLLITFFVNKKTFGTRGDDPDNPCYLRFEDYSDILTREKYRCGYYNECIDGYIYSLKDATQFKGFIILVHGFGGTHIQYLVDIAYLCKEGYRVLAFDQYGVGLSEGKSMYSFSNGIYVTENVIKHVIEKNINNYLPIILYGHSWGAYCVAGALKKNPLVDKAVIRSGFTDPVKEMLYMIKQMAKPLYYILLPLYRFCYFILFSHSSMIKANKALSKNNKTKCLITQAENDTFVGKNCSLAYHYLKKPQENVEVFLTKTGMHNSIITEQAQENYKNYTKQYEQLTKITEPIEKQMRIDQFILSMNRIQLYPYNDEVKDKILTFIEN